jgi:hypothetical protein
MKQSGTEHHIDANVAIASLQNVIVIVLKGPARVPDIERMRDLEAHALSLELRLRRDLGVKRRMYEIETSCWATAQERREQPHKRIVLTTRTV